MFILNDVHRLVFVLQTLSVFACGEATICRLWLSLWESWLAKGQTERVSIPLLSSAQSPCCLPQAGGGMVKEAAQGFAIVVAAILGEIPLTAPTAEGEVTTGSTFRRAFGSFLQKTPGGFG